VLIALAPAGDTTLLHLLGEQQAELASLDGSVPYPPHDAVDYVVGYLDGRPMACGGLQHLDTGVGEIKRMYVRPAYRRRGYSRLILAALEERAAVVGYHTLRLETGSYNAAAVGLYKAAGYRQIPVYGEYAGDPLSVCFEKRIASPAP
jgi:ribosomal protein S18 acetylase RimI-like enzyme